MRIRLCLLKEILEREPEKNLICWGTGKNLKKLCDQFIDLYIQMKVLFLIDNASDRIGQQFDIFGEKKWIYSFEEAEQKIKNNDILVITCAKYWEILSQILNREAFTYVEIVIYPSMGHEFSVEDSLLKNRWLEKYMVWDSLQDIVFFQSFLSYLPYILKLRYTKLNLHFFKADGNDTHIFQIESTIEKQEMIGEFYIDPFNKYDKREWLEKCRHREMIDQRMIFFVYIEDNKKILMDDFFEQPNIYVDHKDETALVFVDGYHHEQCESCSIFVVSHKDFVEPKDNLYRSIYVGEIEGKKEKIYSDDRGDNIAGLNDKINECTALYWIWKNSKSKYVGLNHYRRYFSDLIDRDRILSRFTVSGLLKRFDIIVAQKIQFGKVTVYQQLKDCLIEDVFETGYHLIEDSIRRNQPEYLDTFYQVIYGNEIYPCNMFITSKVICDKYCEWLFSIILEVATQISVDHYDVYNKRVIGFFAERLLTVWLHRQRLSIMELPIVLKEV